MRGDGEMVCDGGCCLLTFSGPVPPHPGCSPGSFLFPLQSPGLTILGSFLIMTFVFSLEVALQDRWLIRPPSQVPPLWWFFCLLLLFFIYSRSLLNVLNVYFISAFYFQDFGKVMTMLFNTLSRIFIAILPRKKCHNFVTAVTIHSDFGAQEGKIHCCFNFFPIYLTMK